MPKWVESGAIHVFHILKPRSSPGEDTLKHFLDSCLKTDTQQLKQVCFIKTYTLHLKKVQEKYRINEQKNILKLM